MMLNEEKPDCQIDGFQTVLEDSFDKVEAATVIEICGEQSAGAAGQGQSIQCKKPNLILQIPCRESSSDVQQHESVKINLPATPTPRRVNFLSTPSDSITNPSPTSSSRGISPLKNLLPRLSFKHRGLSSDVEKGEASASGAVIESSISRSLSLMFSPRIKRALSFPVAPSARSNGQTAYEGSVSGPLDSNMKSSISRSLSVLTNGKDKKLKRADSFFRVIATTPQVREGDFIAPSITCEAENGDADGEDIPEEEAVCRICFVELSEGGQTLKLECSCRGELALAHQECAVKWFSIKGNTTCDICKQEVQNLPVTLLRIQSVVSRNGSSLARDDGYSVWHDIPIMAIVSVLAYFCFLEELLVGTMNTSAIFISLPFCCFLGLLSTTTSYAAVKRRFVWMYAATQFAFVVLFANLFYSVVGMQVILSILLGTFAGFGVAIIGKFILVELFRWRVRWLRRSAQDGSQTTPRQSQSTESPNASVAGSSTQLDRATTGENVSSC
ncbi:unnamed protein product [Rhodiola kirilowii]